MHRTDIEDRSFSSVRRRTPSPYSYTIGGTGIRAIDNVGQSSCSSSISSRDRTAYFSTRANIQ